MTERPILFNGEMVRAILNDSKTQTRRPVHKDIVSAIVGNGGNVLYRNPFGKIGDQLWVRETFVELVAVSPADDEPMTIGVGERLIEPPTSWIDDKGRIRWHYDGLVVAYRANSDIKFCDGDGFSEESGMADKNDLPRWKPSIHMPRWASRIDLEITNVRIERVQSITEEDALSEGLVQSTEHSAKFAFNFLWDSIYNNYRSNPWVWIVEFKEYVDKWSPIASSCFYEIDELEG